MPAGPTGDRRGRRLRDLDGPERLVAALVGLLLVLPVVVSAGRAVADDLVPSGDEAGIAVRVHDVLSTDPPLTGLPSTSDLYGTGIRTMHPGPIEFYLLALPARRSTTHALISSDAAVKAPAPSSSPSCGPSSRAGRASR